MQFFYMSSFVVAVSYAAALPQPAGLSKSGSDSFLPSTLDPNEPFKSPFTDSNVSSMNLASTIDNVGDGNANLYKDGEKVRQKISGPAGDMVTKYIRKNCIYVGSVTENLQKIGRSFQRTLYNRGLLISQLMRPMRLFESSKALLGYLGRISQLGRSTKKKKSKKKKKEQKEKRLIRMRSTDSDRSVRATPKKARDASPPLQDDLWVVVKNLSQQVAAQQVELATLNNALALQQKTTAIQQKTTANLEKVLSNMASQMTSTSEANQTALAAILARLEAGPVVPQVVVPNNKDYPPLPLTGATSKRKTVATKPNPTTTTATTTTTTTTDQPSKDTRFADAVKRRLTHQQLVERQPKFRKADAAAWLALKRETSVPAHSAPKVELSSGLRLIYASGFPYAKPGDLRKAMQGARIRTSAVRDIRWISRQVVQLLVDTDYVSAFTRIITSLDATIVKSFKAWIPRSEAADKDKLAAILSFAAKTVTTIQRSPDVKARNFLRSLLASIGGKTLEAATAEAAKIRVQTPGFDISTMEIVPKESLPVKKATEKEPAAPAVDSPSDMAAEILQKSKMTVLLLQSPLSLTLKCVCNE
ncbi:hypothetical protein BASA83_013361 [Batrachochytrium salamandrivorans]|nr:hypothetical protein BASA83_013361 [Batrachochytrium salamandrivorans]